MLLGSCLAATTGCDITSFTGPAFVHPGTTVQYELAMQSAGASAAAFDIHVLLRVPTDFNLTASSYSGKVQGSPVSGSPTVSTSDPSAGCNFAGFVGSPGALYQDIWFSETFAGTDGPGDYATLTAEFAVDPNAGVPKGYQLLAATAYDEAGSGFCAETETTPVHIVAGVPAVGAWGLAVLGAGLVAAGALAKRRLA